jgi:manganese transport protein
VGPAFVAAVAYVDPGNFATNITAGAHHGYLLVWVVIVANLTAMVVQYLSAKLGVVTGRDLCQVCRERYSRPITLGLWIQAEIVAMATDLAEFIGAALGLNLLFGIPLFPAALITAVIAFGILALQQRGYRRFEIAIIALLAAVFLGFGYDLILVGVPLGEVLGGLVPRWEDTDSIVLIAGIVGATVMPHAVYLHSALTKNRISTRGVEQRRHLLRYVRLDVCLGLGLAGIINLAMLLVAAGLFSNGPTPSGDPITAAHTALEATVGSVAALAFGVALLASGLSSSSVGTYAGQVVMQGFIGRRIPLIVRRVVTMLPALIVLGIGLQPTASLVVSQVILSFGIPFALVPLIALTRRRDVMGTFANSRPVTIIATVAAVGIIVLNVVLLVVTFAG